jgi:hypothetical protein
MIDQFIEGFRKASGSALQMQQDVFRQWSQQWTATPTGLAIFPGELGSKFQRRAMELTVDALNKQRAVLESTYRLSIEIFTEALRISEKLTSQAFANVPKTGGPS